MAAYGRRFGVGVGLVSGAVAVAVTIGLGGAHAGTADQLAGIAVAGDNADSTELLIIAGTNFGDARDVITGIDTSELSDSMLSAVAALDRFPSIIDRTVDIVSDRLAPAEATILEHSGSMSSLIDQLFFAPLNQQWADAGESMLDAAQEFEGAVGEGSVADAMSAQFQMLGITFGEVIPLALVSAPVVWIGSLFDDAVTMADFFDFGI
ncbi:hypothetical protein [Mycolicibacter senuensis]|uniref:Uncharacterized protein n=1 Tax=Mycolicibacter senuensis TaxID=386913 RepID=A0A7I9XJJ7_9MYCO|nr:hypothetical protein [Mycolicibacter senuensis]ORW68713.1 hypothetical protein AWC24_07340 [Mycolicibacter senuensis]GFG69888.1 hypothetical protein MSEN_16080 [Mycolicibacter senuensis]